MPESEIIRRGGGLTIERKETVTNQKKNAQGAVHAAKSEIQAKNCPAQHTAYVGLGNKLVTSTEVGTSPRVYALHTSISPRRSYSFRRRRRGTGQNKQWV